MTTDAETEVASDTDTPTAVRLVRRWLASREAPPLVLAIAAALWVAVFVTLSSQRHSRYGTFGFDLGIYDQAIWLLSRFKEPFVTVRGMNFFGHHMNPLLVLFVPFYWMGAGPTLLLWSQAVAQAAGSMAIFLLARDVIGDRWLAAGLGLLVLLHPTSQYLVWEFFHPDALAITPLLFAYWAARTRRWRHFAVFAVIAAACKEDVALALAVIGVIVALRGDRRRGAITAGLSLGWYVLATRFLMVRANGGLAPFYDQFFGELGSSPTEVAKNAVIHPGQTWSLVTAHDRVAYVRDMLAPFAFLPLIGLAGFVVAAPMLATNLLTSFPYAREIRYHYAALVLVGCLVGTVEAVALLARHGRGIARFLVGLCIATSLAATVAWGPSPLSVRYRAGLWPAANDPRLAAKVAARHAVPERAPASVTYYFTPHMTHRTAVYEWPEPWVRVNWGINGERLPDPGTVEWLVLDRATLADRDRALLRELLTSGQFRIESDVNGIVVAHRVRAGGRIDVDALTPIAASDANAP